MNPQEAIKRIKKHNEIHSRAEKAFAIHITEAMNMGIKALEKQIPKKLVVIGFEKCCPMCQEAICSLGDDGNYGNYCLNCGQALDWSDE